MQTTHSGADDSPPSWEHTAAQPAGGAVEGVFRAVRLWGLVGLTAGFVATAGLTGIGIRGGGSEAGTSDTSSTTSIGNDEEGVKFGRSADAVDGIFDETAALEGVAIKKEQFWDNFGGSASGGSSALEWRREVPSNSATRLGLVPLLLSDKVETESDSLALSKGEIKWSLDDDDDDDMVEWWSVCLSHKAPIPTVEGNLAGKLGFDESFTLELSNSMDACEFLVEETGSATGVITPK